jgi:hypothetical protein
VSTSTVLTALHRAASCCAVFQVEASIQEALSGMAQGLASLEQQMGEAGSSDAQLNARLEKLTGGVGVRRGATRKNAQWLGGYHTMSDQAQHCISTNTGPLPCHNGCGSPVDMKQLLVCSSST